MATSERVESGALGVGGKRRDGCFSMEILCSVVAWRPLITSLGDTPCHVSIGSLRLHRISEKQRSRSFVTLRMEIELSDRARYYYRIMITTVRRIRATAKNTPPAIYTQHSTLYYSIIAYVYITRALAYYPVRVYASNDPPSFFFPFPSSSGLTPLVISIHL